MTFSLFPGWLLLTTTGPLIRSLSYSLPALDLVSSCHCRHLASPNRLRNPSLMIRSVISTHGRRRSAILDIPLIQRVTSRPPFALTSRVCHRAYAAAATVSSGSQHGTQMNSLASQQQAAISGKLAEIHRLLAVDFGGSDDWLRRVDAAREDLASTRPTTMGGKDICGACSLTDQFSGDNSPGRETYCLLCFETHWQIPNSPGTP